MQDLLLGPLLLLAATSFLAIGRSRMNSERFRTRLSLVVQATRGDPPDTWDGFFVQSPWRSELEARAWLTDRAELVLRSFDSICGCSDGSARIVGRFELQSSDEGLLELFEIVGPPPPNALQPEDAEEILQQLAEDLV
jgi:hypothetical protein